MNGGASFDRPARVLILEPQLKQYRKRFLLDLAARLRASNIELVYAYSAARSLDARRSDTVELDEGVGVKLPAHWMFGERVVLQPAFGLIRTADLVIVDQANKLLINYLLLVLSRLRMKRVAYWGHGYNRQETKPGISEWVKSRLLTQVDWWFAYTDGVARYLIDHGVSPATITSVHNTIDTRELTDSIARLSEGDLNAVRSRLGIALHGRVGLFCGSLYPDKKLEFLLDAAAALRRRIPEFHLVIVGDGPDRGLVEAAARTSPYVHYVGPAFGEQRAGYFAISDVFLMPGLVGLAVVDAFAAGLPVFTTDVPIHSPEIEYVVAGENGAMTPHDTQQYANEIANVLVNDARLRSMSEHARATAARLTMTHMVEAFADGIERCLEAKRGR